MKLQTIVNKLDLKPLSNMDDRDVEGVFISDMLSDVMSSANAGDLWLTVQTHKNVVSAANLVDISGIIITHGKTVSDGTIELANRFHVVILWTELTTFDLASKLVAAGVSPNSK